MKCSFSGRQTGWNEENREEFAVCKNCMTFCWELKHSKNIHFTCAVNTGKSWKFYIATIFIVLSLPSPPLHHSIACCYFVQFSCIVNVNRKKMSLGKNKHKKECQEMRLSSEFMSLYAVNFYMHQFRRERKTGKIFSRLTRCDQTWRSCGFYWILQESVAHTHKSWCCCLHDQQRKSHTSQPWKFAASKLKIFASCNFQQSFQLVCRECDMENES